jgi:hypothetical protein
MKPVSIEGEGKGSGRRMAIRRTNERNERKRGERREWDEGRRAIKNTKKGDEG